MWSLFKREYIILAAVLGKTKKKYKLVYFLFTPLTSHYYTSAHFRIQKCKI